MGQCPETLDFFYSAIRDLKFRGSSIIRSQYCQKEQKIGNFRDFSIKVGLDY